MGKALSLLLLYNKASASAPIAYALKAKGLDVIAVDNYKDLVNFLKNKQIDFVGLSVNHASEPAVAEVLKKNPQIPFFSFVEDALPASARKLEYSVSDMKVAGVASAYTIWLCIGNAVKAKQASKDKGGKVTVVGFDDKDPSIGSVVSIGTEAKEYNGALTVQAEEESQRGMAATLSLKKLKDSTHRALNKYKCREITSTDKFQPMSKMAFLPILNEKEDGIYLIYSANKEFPKIETLTEIKNSVTVEMNNKDFITGEVFHMEIPTENASKWLRDNCKFSFIYQDNGEAAIGYIRTGKVAPRLRADESGEMYGFDQMELTYPMTLPCDLYLYFNRNEKMVPYLKSGDVIAEEKIRRLEQSGVSEMFVKVDDRKKFEFFLYVKGLDPVFKKIQGK